MGYSPQLAPPTAVTTILRLRLLGTRPLLLIGIHGPNRVKHHGPDRVGGPRIGPAVRVDDPAVELEGPADEELGAVRPVEAMESIDGRGAATEGSGQRGAVGGPVALGVDLVVDVAE